MSINFQALEDMIRVNEERIATDQVYMRGWFHPCQTHGCLCGNYVLVYKPELRRGIFELDFQTLRTFLGLTDHEFGWLFQMNPLRYFSSNQKRQFSQGNALDLSGRAALARLKKFVAYKKEKASVSLEQGRQISGTNICHRLSLSV